MSHRALCAGLLIAAACTEGATTIDRSLGCAEQASERFKRACFAEEHPRYEAVLRHYTDTLATLTAAPDSVRDAQRAWLEMRSRDCGTIADSLAMKGEGDLDVLACISVRNRQRVAKQYLAFQALSSRRAP